jgi:catechol 2,3-dioxygenase-like lactoylglutathione lyase family enzyme
MKLIVTLSLFELLFLFLLLYNKTKGGIHMVFSFNGIDHFQLAAPKGCEEEARKFFVDILGLKEIPKPENLQNGGGCWFQCGRQEIHVGVQEDFIAAKKAHPALLVTNLGSLKEHLTKNGISFKEDFRLTDRERMFVSDPFGNRIEFLEY